MGVGLGIGVLVAVCSIPLVAKIRTMVNEEFAADPEGGRPVKEKKEAKEVKDRSQMTMMEKAQAAVMTSLNADPHAVLENDAYVQSIHSNAEKFEPKTEAVFRYIQIFTAICDSFAHGANDVANAMGPFMAIYFIYQTGEVSKKAKTGDDAYWILAIGGVGIGLGLLLYGYKIMRAIGVKLAVITPSRGFAIELGAAIVIIIGSYLGLPLSTTHCQVGATTGVALLEGGKGTNKIVLLKCVVGWIITLIVVGFSTGLLVAQGIHAPLAGETDNIKTAQGVFLNQECTGFVGDQIQSGDYTPALCPELQYVNNSFYCP